MRSEASGIVGALSRALVARELGELTRRALPYPHDPDAEWTLLCALARMPVGPLRLEVKPEWFFLALHAAMFRAVVACEPRDTRSIAIELASETNADRQLVIDMAEALEGSEWTLDEVAGALARVAELHAARELIDALERLNVSLRVGGMTVDRARRELRKVAAE